MKTRPKYGQVTGTGQEGANVIIVTALEKEQEKPLR